MNLWLKYKGLARLALVLLIAPLLVYKYALGGTLKQWRTTAKYRQQTEQLRIAGAQSAKPQNTCTIDTEMVLSGLVVAELLPFIESEKLWIEHFSPCVTSDRDGIRLTTGQLSVRGKFTGIVGLIDRIEREMPWCKILSLQFRVVKPRNRGSTKTLVCTIYVQQIMTMTND